MATQTPQVTDDQTMETSSAVTLPQVLACKHSETGHFLAVVTDGPMRDYLEFNADVDQDSPCAQFVVEMVDNNTDVHLKSCYNNKYLVRESDRYNAFITATAVQPVADTGAWNNTLFQPMASADGTKFYLFKPLVSGIGESMHQNGDQGRQYLRLSVPGGPLVYLLAVDCTPPAAVVTLPEIVSFRGDNDNTLQVSIEESELRAYNVFDSENRIDKRALYEIVPVDNRFVKIKSYYYDKFLRKIDDDLIQGDSLDDSGDDALFEVLKRPETAATVVIRNMGNNRFCTRSPSSGNQWPDFLVANGAQADAKEAHIKVVEPVITRDITNSPENFRMSDALFYDRETFEMDKKSVANTHIMPSQMYMTLTFTKTRTSYWDIAETIKWGGSSFLRSYIPQITGDSEVVYRGTYQGLYSWGQPKDESETYVIHHEVLVPPRTTIYATLVAKKSTCKVPFSYRQDDVLTQEIRKTYNKDNGIYIGTQVYGYDIVEKAVPFSGENEAP